MADSQLINQASSDSSAAQVASAATACDKCEKPRRGEQGWCRHCGWYPLLSTFVELDPWDRPTAIEEVKPKPPSKLAVWVKMIPIWAWQISGGVVVVLAVSLAARLILPAHSSYRFVWTITQMVAGTLVFFSAHVSCYLYAVLENDHLVPLDIVIRPLSIWITAARDLPITFWRVAIGIWALAAICSAPLVGGFAGRDLLDWGGTPARVDLVKAIAEEAKNRASDFDNLQDAIEALAKEGDQGTPAEATSSDESPPMLVDCLVIGYEPTSDDDFRSLLLAAEVKGKLRFVGTVNEGISTEVRAELVKRMKELQRPKPFVPCYLPATWLQPTLTCRVSAKEFSTGDKLVHPVFKQMLSEISVPQ